MIYQSPAKINLFLHVISTRDDGYHNLQTIFQLLDFGDELRFNIRSDGDIVRIYGNENIPQEQDLIIQSAYKLKARFSCSFGADIGVKKKYSTRWWVGWR